MTTVRARSMKALKGLTLLGALVCTHAAHAQHEMRTPGSHGFTMEEAAVCASPSALPVAIEAKANLSDHLYRGEMNRRRLTCDFLVEKTQLDLMGRSGAYLQVRTARGTVVWIEASKVFHLAF